ncbi:hypothetical protein ERJ75_000763100 [Trypanosoma vivax]|uniref:Uncharacterized protein n=1 Tax=Trypanosoma vivax (strain Y486) TaxID=1055687 RepID=G0TV98_TRYVY|nr:hypothetical protein TRVL_09783 [Trypanosoma vivax]KAH8613713.1 hypothetical protein ERJ75_000763100 [Trypanosoma vivax]CCC47864.1 conserved hypothetical protein [Trypanosoma vivax Y486]
MNGSEPKSVSVTHRAQQFTAKVVLADVLTAGFVGFAAAIPISIIDYSIMARVAGTTSSSMRELCNGIRTLILRPHRFFLPCAENKCAVVFGACFAVYATTYMASNVTKSYYESHGHSVNSCNLAAGLGGGFLNTVMTMWKDSLILRVLPIPGQKSGGKPVPWVTRGLFIGRDTLTCLAAFTIAPKVADWLANYFWNAKESTKRKQLPPPEGKIHIPMATVDAAQIATPAMLQVVTTAMHIFAIRYHQTYPLFTHHDFFTSMRETYVTSLLLRITRIIPSFGIGGIVNREMRHGLLERAESST